MIKKDAGIEVVNGRLKFENDEEFMSYVNQYDNMDAREREMFESRLGIDSLENLYQDLIYQAQYTEDTYNLCMLDELCMNMPTSMKTYINSNGEIQIGDSVTCFVNDKIYSVHVSDIKG